MLWEKDSGMVNVYKGTIPRFYRDPSKKIKKKERERKKKDRKKERKREREKGRKRERKGNGMGKEALRFYNLISLTVVLLIDLVKYRGNAGWHKEV